MATIWPSIISTVRKSNSPFPARIRTGALLGIAVLLAARQAAACPFCTTLQPTLAQRRAAAIVSALAEVRSVAAGGAAAVKLHRAITGRDVVKDHTELTVPLDTAASPGELLLLFGRGTPGEPLEKLAWHAVPVDELGYAYFARAPALAVPPSERLAYFAPFLEHANPLVAEDAYLEFGHAPFDVVAQNVELLKMDRVRHWLTDPNVPGPRKGFYGLALGLARQPEDRRANAALLREQILKPEDDFARVSTACSAVICCWQATPAWN